MATLTGRHLRSSLGSRLSRFPDGGVGIADHDTPSTDIPGMGENPGTVAGGSIVALPWLVRMAQ